MVEKPEKKRPRLFLIDGYALIYRSFFAMINRPLTTSRGENTSAAWGLTQFLLKILREHEPDYLGVVLDSGTSERTAKYPAYKATREKMPDELRASFPRIRELLSAFRIPVIELLDHEADDVIGTLATSAVEQGLETVIVSGDKDFYQLIRPGICLLNPGRGGPTQIGEEWVDVRNASERLGVPPERVVDYLALIGDASDNIPGARGIGPKTAIALIEAGGTVEEILEQASTLAGKRAREALHAHRQDVLLSKDLVTIRKDLPIEPDLEELHVAEPDRDRLRELFLALEFHSLVREYAAPEKEVEPERQEYASLSSPDAVRSLVDRAREVGRFSLDLETTDRHPLRADIVGISLALEPGEAFYLPFGHRLPASLELRAPGDGHGEVRNLPPLDSPELRPLVELLEDPRVEKVGQNLKYDLLVLRRLGIDLAGLSFDTMVAAYVIAPGQREYGLDALALRLLDQRTTAYEDVCGKGKKEIPFAEVPLEGARDYACQGADIPLRLMAILEGDLERHQLRRLFHEIEMPLIHVLAEMEWDGIRIDEALFRQQSRKLAEELRLIVEDIYKEAGGEFNINSTRQLREVLFDRLELPVVKRTKTGASTDASVLESLAEEGHRLPGLLMEYRQLDKLKSTYIDALPALVNPRTGRIHTSFNQTIAATGRLSSSDPNLQSIPIRTEIGAEIRKGFVPADGHLFLTADYSQIELRVLAHLSGDPSFIEGFREGVDIHRQTAALVFGVPPEDVTAEMRAAAKTINFATIYGVGPFALARRLGTSHAEARSFIDQYFERFPGVRHYLESQIQHARDKGYVETLSGRRRYIPEIRSKNFNIRQFGERAATNAPVQGSAADIIKLAMIGIHRALRDAGSGAHMLLQVHDELVFEVPRDRLEPAKARIKELMEGALELEVPLEVALGSGESWFDCK